MFRRECQKFLGVPLRLGSVDEPIKYISANEHVSERQRMIESASSSESASLNRSRA